MRPPSRTRLISKLMTKSAADKINEKCCECKDRAVGIWTDRKSYCSYHFNLKKHKVEW